MQRKGKIRAEFWSQSGRNEVKKVELDSMAAADDEEKKNH